MTNEVKTATPQDIIKASIEAQNKGVTVNWQATLLHYHNAATLEINRLQGEVKALGEQLTAEIDSNED